MTREFNEGDGKVSDGKKKPLYADEVPVSVGSSVTYTVTAAACMWCEVGRAPTCDPRSPAPSHPFETSAVCRAARPSEEALEGINSVVQHVIASAESTCANVI